MKNPRSIHLDKELIKTHRLSTNPPPKGSLFWKLWNACTPIAEKALRTSFIQGISAGTLDPVKYGGFNVNDAYYCFHGAEDYQLAADKCDEPHLKAFLTKKYESYEKYNAAFPTTWHIKDASGVVPSDVVEKYSSFERTVVANEDPIYALIVMIPCEYLWAWLGAQLSPAKPGNLYASWITENNDPSGAYAMGNFLNDFQQHHEVDEEKAMRIYAQAMSFEQQNFAQG